MILHTFRTGGPLIVIGFFDSLNHFVILDGSIDLILIY